eukprot:TRINITY_DN53879_c0_g1_i1.p1 TRINITY_DN53879_c0_g1~~TRINITY_DN53879_c0_g1_i1.p1  ORF type:complete len:356 (+),score=-9.84 TRINITY_DN53879_c0_g1_i1:16-1083(+)
MPGMFQKIQSHFSETCVSLSRTQIQNSQAFLVMLFADTNQHLQTYTVPNSYYFDSLLHQSTQNISNSQNMTDIQDGRIENVEFYITHSPSFYYDIYVNISNEGTVRTKFIVQIFDGISTRFISDDYIYIDAGEFYNKVVRLSYADQSSYSKVYKVMLFVDDNQFLQSLVVENKKHYQRINNGSMHNIYVSRDAGVCANITNLSNRVATFFLQAILEQISVYNTHCKRGFMFQTWDRDAPISNATFRSLKECPNQQKLIYTKYHLMQRNWSMEENQIIHAMLQLVRILQDQILDEIVVSYVFRQHMYYISYKQEFGVVFQCIFYNVKKYKQLLVCQQFLLIISLHILLIIRIVVSL